MADKDDLSSLTWLTQQNGTCFHPPTPPETPTPSDEIIEHEETVPWVDYCSVPIKPKMSYAQLITLAMEAKGGQRVLLTEIYDWVKSNFAYFRHIDSSWQNSIRHNLSLNKQFIKVARDQADRGKGSYWMLDSTNLRKDPYCMRRRNFPDNKPPRPKPEVAHPCINPAIKTILEKLEQKPTANVRRPIALCVHPKPPRRMKPSSNKSRTASSANCTTAASTRTSTVRLPSLSDSLKTRKYSSTKSDIFPLDLGAQECVLAGTADNDIDNDDQDSNLTLFKKVVAASDPHAFEDFGSYRPQCEDRVRVEYNWEEFEYHHCANNWGAGAFLPLESGRSINAAIANDHLTTIQSAFSLNAHQCGLSPPNSEDNEASLPPFSQAASGCAGLEVRIPTPDWWLSTTGLKTSINGPATNLSVSALQFSPNPLASPLARVFENLNSSGSSSIGTNLITPDEHPWQEQPGERAFVAHERSDVDHILDLV